MDFLLTFVFFLLDLPIFHFFPIGLAYFSYWIQHNRIHGLQSNIARFFCSLCILDPIGSPKLIIFADLDQSTVIFSKRRKINAFWADPSVMNTKIPKRRLTQTFSNMQHGWRKAEREAGREIEMKVAIKMETKAERKAEEIARAEHSSSCSGCSGISHQQWPRDL